MAIYTKKYALSLACFAAITFLFSGCGKKTASLPPPPEVGVVTVATKPLPVTTELPGRIDAVRTEEVRARVAGILLKENYVEGSDEKAGDLLQSTLSEETKLDGELTRIAETLQSETEALAGHCHIIC